MGRALALDAVDPDVFQEIAVQRLDGERQQVAVRVEHRQCQRGDEQRVQLERAVVALARQMRAQMRDLRTEAVEDDLGRPVAETFEAIAGGEATPGVDPVLDAAADDIGRIDRDGHLADPGPHEALPGLLKPRLAGFAKCPGKIKAVVELHPFEPPFADPAGSAAPSQSGSTPRSSARPWWSKPALADTLGDRAIAVHTLDDAEDRPRRDDAGHARCSRLRLTRRSACGCSTRRPSCSR